MKSKAPLLLMEQMIMLLVFALAAALCLQAFVKSDASSRRIQERDTAVNLVQNVTEVARSRGGDMGETLTETAECLGYSYAQGILWQDFDENWNLISGNGAYRLEAQGVPADVPGLHVLQIRVFTGGADSSEDSLLFEIETAWQMEGGNG